MTIEQRIAEIERQLAEVKAEMKPTGLVEVVEDLLRSPTFCEDWPLMHEKLSGCVRREKRIAEKREGLIDYYRGLAACHGKQCCCRGCELLDAYDEECAK